MPSSSDSLPAYLRDEAPDPHDDDDDDTDDDAHGTIWDEEEEEEYNDDVDGGRPTSGARQPELSSQSLVAVGNTMAEPPPQDDLTVSDLYGTGTQARAKMLNAFGNKMRKRAPENIKAKWAHLKKLPPVHPDREEFIATVLESVNLEEEYFTTLQEFGRYTEDGEDGCWISANKIFDEEGYEAGLEMISSKRVLSRKHKNLPPDTRMKWPYDQQISCVLEKWKT